MADQDASTIDGTAEIRELEVRMRRVAQQLIDHAQRADGGAVDLLARGVALQRAAFLLQAELDENTIDLRDGSTQR